MSLAVLPLAQAQVVGAAAAVARHRRQKGPRCRAPYRNPPLAGAVVAQVADAGRFLASFRGNPYTQWVFWRPVLSPCGAHTVYPQRMRGLAGKFGQEESGHPPSRRS